MNINRVISRFEWLGCLYGTLLLCLIFKPGCQEHCNMLEYQIIIVPVIAAIRCA